ncbi:hypothetical protein [Algoriphagus limi]|uniref:Uncharacterized protein n=1 Tax=Algoriphagus limi TaxID=2975273 RepID=A0ABT2G2L4_9BACT|nr:hypothetical protein [Algoriphagus limi]MCS5489038.1 hypothetical protein [Algoriphagus limi]
MSNLCQQDGNGNSGLIKILNIECRMMNIEVFSIPEQDMFLLDYNLR